MNEVRKLSNDAFSVRYKDDLLFIVYETVIFKAVLINGRMQLVDISDKWCMTQLVDISDKWCMTRTTVGHINRFLDENNIWVFINGENINLSTHSNEDRKFILERVYETGEYKLF